MIWGYPYFRKHPYHLFRYLSFPFMPWSHGVPELPGPLLSLGLAWYLLFKKKGHGPNVPKNPLISELTPPQKREQRITSPNLAPWPKKVIHHLLVFVWSHVFFSQKLNSQVPHSAGRWSKPKNVSCSKMLSPGSADRQNDAVVAGGPGGPNATL